MSGECMQSPHLRLHAKGLLFRAFVASCAIGLA